MHQLNSKSKVNSQDWNTLLGEQSLHKSGIEEAVPENHDVEIDHIIDGLSGLGRDFSKQEALINLSHDADLMIHPRAGVPMERTAASIIKLGEDFSSDVAPGGIYMCVHQSKSSFSKRH